MAELDALDDTGDDLTHAVLEFLELALALGIADLLEDHLLGGLRGDAAELDRGQRIDDIVADHGARLQLLRSLQVDLLEIIIDRFDHLDDAPQAQVAGVRVELGADVVLGAVASVGGALDRVLHRLDHDALVDHLLGGDRIGDRDQLGLVGGKRRWPSVCLPLRFRVLLRSEFLLRPRSRAARWRRQCVSEQQLGVGDLIEPDRHRAHACSRRP